MSLKTVLLNFANSCKQDPKSWMTFPSNVRADALAIIEKLEECGFKVTIDRPCGMNAFSDDVDIWFKPGLSNIDSLEQLAVSM